MKWLRRLALALGAVVAIGAIGAAVVWWRLRQDPAELAGAPAMDAAEAEQVLREMSQEPPRPTPRDGFALRRGSHGPSRDTPPAPGLRREQTESGAADSAAGSGRPYRLTLGQRQVAALVVTQVARAAGGRVGDVRVAVRDGDLFAAARLRGTALAGSVLSVSAVPAAGRGGRLCLRLGEPHVGGQRIPTELIEQLGGEGARVPRTLCMNPRAVGLPGPVRSARVSGGGVVVEGVR